MNTKPNEYHTQADAFLAKHGIKCRISLSNTKDAGWQPSGNHYRVTLSRGAIPAWKAANQCGKRLTFDFWGSLNDKEKGVAPHAYDVLACLSSEINCPETYADFCSEYGYQDRDEYKAYKRLARFAGRLRAFFTNAEREELAEIQ